MQPKIHYVIGNMHQGCGPRREAKLTSIYQSRDQVQEAGGVFITEYLRDSFGQVIFACLVGRDTSIKEMIPKLSLPPGEGGYRAVSLASGERLAFNDKHLEKRSTRFDNTIFGSVVQMFLYDPRTVQCNDHTSEAYLIFRDADEQWPHEQQRRLWALVKRLCTIPLADQWASRVVDFLSTEAMLQRLTGRGVFGWRLTFDDQGISEFVSRGVRSGLLPVDELIDPTIVYRPDTPQPETPDVDPTATMRPLDWVKRRQAIADGDLFEIHNTSLLRDAGYAYPVFFTKAAWHDAVIYRDWVESQVDTRLWRVLCALKETIQAAQAAGNTGPSDTVEFLLERYPEGERLALKAVIGIGDDQRAVITVMLATED